MLNTVKIDLSRRELIKAIKTMKKKERDAFLEDLLAATSPEYLESIREARADYKAGRVKTHKEVFGE
jgi:PHD/YefM family antitoxin component YafN of YafNO toxin-antitoxin module